jgi:hypothetical protein
MRRGPQKRQAPRKRQTQRKKPAIAGSPSLLDGAHDDRRQGQVRVAAPVFDRSEEAELQPGRQVLELRRLLLGRLSVTKEESGIA